MENSVDSSVQKAAIPWQERQNLGFFKAIWQTIRYVLFKPGEFFDNLEIKDSIKEPYIFYFIMTLVPLSITLAIKILFDNKFVQKDVNVLSFVFGGVVILLVVLIVIFIHSAILHLSVMLLRGKGGFKGTFNVLAYNAASGIFSVIPFIGPLISGIWSIVVGVKGFKRVHNFSTIKAVIAYFGVFAIVFIIALLAAIAIPNLLRARLNANEAVTKATIKTISQAIESYSTVKGQLPLSEYDLKRDNYLSEYYDKMTHNGYAYSLNFTKDDYEIIATPETCGATGTKVFTTNKDGSIIEKACERKP